MQSYAQFTGRSSLQENSSITVSCSGLVGIQPFILQYVPRFSRHIDSNAVPCWSWHNMDGYGKQEARLETILIHQHFKKRTLILTG